MQTLKTLVWEQLFFDSDLQAWCDCVYTFVLLAFTQRLFPAQSVSFPRGCLNKGSRGACQPSVVMHRVVHSAEFSLHTHIRISTPHPPMQREQKGGLLLLDWKHGVVYLFR